MVKKKFRKAIIFTFLTSYFFISLSPSISLAAAMLTEEQHFEVVVVYKNDRGKQKILDKSVEVNDELVTLKAMNAVLTESAIDSLVKDPDIDYLERDLKQKIELLGTPGQWNVEAVNAPKAWEQGYSGQGVKVAIIDSGIGVHADLPNVIQRLSFTQSTGAVADVAPYDHNGHGTHVAGIVGAKQGGATSGGLDYVGVAPNVSLYSLKVVDGTQGTVLDVIEAIDWAIANKMDIINLSLGLTTHVQLLQDAVDRAFKAGIVVVGAAGNDGNGFPINYPAKYDSVIAVSSVDQTKGISGFSSTGPEVEFTAPGGAVKSTYMSGGTATYATVGGTSQAAPHVAGFAALLLQKDPSKSPNEIRADLKKYVEDLGAEGHDELYGHGFINYLAFDETAPAEVTSLQAIEKTEESITVSWTNPADTDFAKTVILSNGLVVGETTDKTQNTFKIEKLQPDTEYNIVVKTLDAKGNESVGATLVVTTEADTIAPAEVSGVAVMEVTTDSAVIGFNLPADEDFAKVNVYVNSIFNGETTTGTYSLENLDAGTDFRVVVKTVDVNGNESDGQEVIVSTLAAKDISAPAEVAELTVSNTTSNSFLVTWTNPSDLDFDQVNLYLDGKLVNETKERSFTFNGMTSETVYTITAKTIDVNGNESNGVTISASTISEADIVPPAVPSISPVTDNSNTVFGVTEGNAIVKLYISGVYQGSMQADQEGNYSFTIPIQKAGKELKVTATDEAGNVSEIKVVFVIDKTAPKVPTMNSVADNSNTVSGVTEGNAIVKLYISGVYQGSMQADQEGNYSFTIPIQKAGTEIKVTATDEAGNISEKRLKVLDKTAPVIPAVNPIGDNITVITGKVEPFTTVKIYISEKFQKSMIADRYGNFLITIFKQKAGTKITVTATDIAGNISSPKIITVLDKTAPAIPSIKPVSDHSNFISGKTEPYASIKLYFNNKYPKSVMANKSGYYKVNIKKQKAGTTIRIFVRDKAGNLSSAKTIRVSDKTAPIMPTINNLTSKSKYVTGKTEKFAAVYVYRGKVKLGKAKANNKGYFKIKVRSQTKGVKIKVYAVDQARNKSKYSLVKVS
jgi:hypothetical protein